MENRRKKLVINKKFQYQYGLLAISLVILVANAFLVIAMLLPTATSVSISSSHAIAIGLSELALIATVWYASIRFSSKVAGPVFVFDRQLKAFCNGELSARIKLRENDLFQQEAEEMNRSLDVLASKIEALSGAANKVSGESDGETLARILAAVDRLPKAEG